MYIEGGREALRALRDHRNLVKAIKEIVRRRYENARVLVFGSVIEGRYTASSDIDVLIVADIGPEERVKLKVEILREIGLHIPVEIHIATPEEFERWYSRFIEKYEEI